MIMKRALLLVVGAAVAVTLAACGSSTTATETSSAASEASAAASSEPMTSEAMTSEAMPSSSEMSSGAMASDSGMVDDSAAAATLVGPGCADYAAQVPDGAGSVGGMAQDTVTTAASNNPLLTTLTAAVSGQVNPGVDLVNTLNSGEFTVFAPVDSAFAKVDAATMTTLTTDSALLSKILTYHVVPGKLSPTEVVGTLTTAEGGTLVVAGSGDNLTVNDANVICGGVQTKNATVYLIDSVLSPPAS